MKVMEEYKSTYPGALLNSGQLAALLLEGEGRDLEFKRSTGELKEGLQTLCAFLNGSGGMVLFGIRPDGTPGGQDVSDKTLRDIAQALDGFDPPVSLEPERLKLAKGKEILILRAGNGADSVPYTYQGRAYERIGSATRKMSQARYEQLLLDRGHARRRWENMPAEGIRLQDLDREEILRTRELAIQQRRISADTGRNVGDVLDRLGLRVKGEIARAAQILFGRTFLPDYPQCQLKMGRFRGTDVTGEIVDNRQEFYNAFAAVREGMAFLERTLPLGARFPEGKIFREDRFPIPPDALREILLNAVMHRDYSHYSGYIAIAVFDDRVEVRSYGRLPAGITVEQLSGPHLSELRNPLIAETFQRTGAVEKWGRGTNRVIEDCKRHGIAAPVFEEKQGFVVVTFRARIADGDPVTPHVAPQVTLQVTPQVKAVLEEARQAVSAEALLHAAGLKDRVHFLKSYLGPMLEHGWLERTIPDKPRSRLQRYRITGAGEAALRDLQAPIPGVEG